MRLAAMVMLALLVLRPQDDPMARLGWLAGCWELERGNRRTLEMWMAPAGGLMLGSSRTLSGGRLVEWEQVRMSMREGRLIYTAAPSGQPAAEFAAVAVTDSGFTVENPQHDFPQRIIYARRGADSLVARIEGKTPRGERGVDYPMRRVACETR